MAHYSAIGLGVRLLLAIGISELMIMLMFQTSGLSLALNPDEKAILDTLLLSCIAGGLIWHWLVRPLKEALENNTELASVVSNTSIGVIIYDPIEPRRITFSNHGFESFTGITKNSIEGKTASEILGSKLYHQLCNALATDENKVTLENCALPSPERHHLVDIVASPVIDADGSVTKIILLITEVTERHRKQVEMRRLLAAIEQSGESVVITDKQGKVEYVNPAFSRITGFSEHEATGSLISQLSGNVDSTINDPILSIIHAEEQWSGQLGRQRKDGSKYDESITISPVYHDAEIAHYVIIQRDTSKERGLNAQLLQAQKLEALGTFASGIAHDFNNALTGILGNLYLLRKNTHEQKALERINTIEELGKHSSEVIKQLLTFSRCTDDEMTSFSLVSTVKESCKMYEVGIPENIQLSINADHGSDLCIHGNIGKVQQVMMNIITNATHALEHKDDGQINIRLERYTANPAATESKEIINKHNIAPGIEMAHLIIEDNGCGMPENILDKVFSPFFTTKPQGKGTGLGLPMCYGIISGMNGAITVSSKEGHGTRFDIYLPLVAEPSVQALASETHTIHFGMGQTIMVVDDHASFRTMSKEILESWGYQVLLAEDGHQSIEVFKQNAENVSMILMDITMPNLGGIAAARKIRQLNADVPLVFVSGYDQADNTPHVHSLPKSKLLSKPYRAQALANIIQEPFFA